MSNKTRFFTIVLGATALAGLAYGVTRRGSQRRTVQPLTSQTQASAQLSAPAAAETPDWETLAVHSTRGSTPDALDVAMSLDGIFDGLSAEAIALTARPNVRPPAPLTGDDEEAPNADDLGLAWLMQATQTEQSLSESDLAPEIENIALIDEMDIEEETDSEEEQGVEGQDEHENFQRRLA